MIKTESLYSLCSVTVHEVDFYDDYEEIQPNPFMYTALEFDISFQRDLSAFETRTNYHQFKCLVIFVRTEGLGYNTDRSYSLDLVNVPIERVFTGTDLEQIDFDYISSFYPSESVSSTKHYGYAPNDTLTLKAGDRYYPPNRSGYFKIQKIIQGYDLRYPFRLSLDLYNNQDSQEFLIRNEIKRCCLKCESDYVFRAYDNDDLLLNRSFLRTLPNGYFVYEPDFVVRVGFINDDRVSNLSIPRLEFQIRGIQHTYSMFLYTTALLSEFQNFVRQQFSVEITGRTSTNIISEKPSFVFESSVKVYCDHPDILSLIVSSFQSLNSSIPLFIRHNEYVNESPFCIYDPDFGDWMVPIENPYKVV